MTVDLKSIRTDISTIFRTYPDIYKFTARLHSVDFDTQSVPEPMGRDYYGSLHLDSDDLINIPLYTPKNNELYLTYLWLKENVGRRTWVKADKESQSFFVFCEGLSTKDFSGNFIIE